MLFLSVTHCSSSCSADYLSISGYLDTQRLGRRTKMASMVCLPGGPWYSEASHSFAGPGSRPTQVVRG